MKKLKRTKLLVLVLAMAMLITPVPQYNAAPSVYIKNAMVEVLNVSTAKVSFDLEFDPANRQFMYLNFFLYDESGNEIDEITRALPDNIDPRKSYSQVFENLEPDTIYSAKVKFNYREWHDNSGKYWGESKYSDFIPFTTPALSDVQLGASIENVGTHSVILKGLMFNTGTGVGTDELDTLMANKVLGKIYGRSGLLVVKQSEYYPDLYKEAGNQTLPDSFQADIFRGWEIGGNFNGFKARNPFINEITFENLEPDTTYVVHSFVYTSWGSFGSSSVAFTTLKEPVLTIDSIDDIDAHQVKVTGTVEIDSGDLVIGCGILRTPSFFSNEPKDHFNARTGTYLDYNTSTGEITFILDGLDPEEEYKTQFYVQTLKGGNSYSEVSIFQTLPEAELPTVLTGDPEHIQGNQGKLTGQVTNKGYTPITEIGFVYSDSHLEPIIGSGTTLKAVITSQTEPIAFDAFAKALDPGTIYYYRAYAKNAEGTSYGEVKTLTTLDAVSVSTVGSADITESTALLTGNVLSTGAIAPTLRGFVISDTHTTPEMGSDDTKIMLNPNSSADIGTYQMEANHLSSGALYYFRAFVVNAQGTFYGDVESFTTVATPTNKPTVMSLSATGILDTSAIANGAVTTPSDTTLLEKGVIWSLFPNPSIGDSHGTKIESVESSPFALTMNGLLPNTTYYYRVYGINEHGTAYGTNISFQTTNEVSALKKAYIESNEVTFITQRTAQFKIDVEDSGTPLFTRKIIYSTANSFPLITDDDVTVINAGTFASTSVGSTFTNLYDLEPNTVYYIRGYTENQYGESYGNVVMMLTDDIGLPVIESATVTNILSNSARLNVQLIASGDLISEYGYIYSSINKVPFANDPDSSKVAFSNASYDLGGAINLLELIPNTEYAVVVYVKNSVGVTYSEPILFTTAEGDSPSVATGDVDAGLNTATATFTLDKGDYEIYETGIVLSTASDPEAHKPGTITLANSVQFSGEHSLIFYHLTPNTEYYSRAYAFVQGGNVIYGSSVPFNTLNYGPPVVSVLRIYDKTDTSVKVSATAIDLLGETLTEKGLLISTESDIDLNDSELYTPYVSGDVAEGEYVTNVTNLIAETIYYAIPYAINDYGVGYGEAVGIIIQEVPDEDPDEEGSSSTPTPLPEATPMPTATPTPVPEATPIPTATPSPVPEATPIPTATPSPVPEATPAPNKPIEATVPGSPEIKEIIQPPENGTVIIKEDNSIEYIPDDSYDGYDTFTIIIINQEGEEEEIIIEIIDEVVVQGGFDELPQTSGIPIAFNWTIGALFIVSGLVSSRKKRTP